ncbi:Homocysteine S-methyltransferase [Rhodocollybia butyracea]|uniref:Homocysteine S-methyltransferase n=1 Tax=Rhodocollybia butyracea TaxID=206335 RepID=A0A9P5P4A5_9AGAR|nr:Homocysteine S-methyltransferase [Rhodocollybia butyracea]
MTSQFKFDSGTIVLDGGFGTTLEQAFRLDISDSPLWSAIAIIDYSDIVIQTHLAFLRAGADIISTSTYQCSYSTFERAGYSYIEARKIMSESVELASQARRVFYEEQLRNGDPIRDIRIALSLGPFGASLQLAQEFNGFYPPPFGPKAYSQVENCNTFGNDGAGEEESIRSLTQFHFERLLIVFENEAAWNEIDCIAFETVPLTREIKAVRRAMGLLNNRITAVASTSGPGISIAKPWWISMVFPDGKYPEMTQDGNSKMVASDVIGAAIEKPSAMYPSPSALGINCTPVEYLQILVSQFEENLESQSIALGFKPWLVLYPNGGDVYDPITRSWVDCGSQSNSAEQWAKALTGTSHTLSNTWAGVILGGCCRTTPTHIEALRRIIHC